MTLAEVLADRQQRGERDRNGPLGALIQADDAIEVVTDGGVVVHRRTIEEMGFAGEYSAAFEVPNMARGLPKGSTLSTNRRYFYLRVTQPKGRGDRAVALGEMVQSEMAWSSPVFLAVDYGAML